MPRISVVMPLYNGEKYVSETIESILDQTFGDFEFIIVNEFGSNVEATGIIADYAKKDSRIHIIQNTERLGLSQSLNVGIEAAKGEYIARTDGDDPSFSERFEKQIGYLDANQDIFMCGTFQRTISPNGVSYEEYPSDPEEVKATLMFGCDITHASVMMRRKLLIENGWRYTDERMSEDYHLWTSILHKVKIANYPEVLVTRRWGFGQKSASGMAVNKDLFIDGCQISATVMMRLGVELENYDSWYVLGGFRNIPHKCGKIDPDKLLDQNYHLLCEIEDKNKEKELFNPVALHNVLVRRWLKWVCPAVGNKAIEYPGTRFLQNPDEHQPNPQMSDVKKTDIKNSRKHTDAPFIVKFKLMVKKMLRPIYVPYFNKIDSIIGEHMAQIIRRLDKSDFLSSHGDTGYVPYLPGEKVRIVFLYQIASFWPSWDTLIEAIKNEPEADVRVVLFDVPMKEIAQIVGAEEFLKQKGIAYINYADFNLYAFNPHIIVYQTPYDREHRPTYLYAPDIRSRGYRIAYITYGIEITKTSKSDGDHFKSQFIQNMWRIYTFSPMMRIDYLRFIEPNVVKALGHPKFDRLYDTSTICQNTELTTRSSGKKIVLWKIHFPFTQKKGGKDLLVTPDLDEYLAFSRTLSSYPDLFFLVMPHPKFIEMSGKIIKEGIEDAAYGIIKNVKESANAYLFEEQDYRPALIEADCFIVDRSAIMIEAGVTNKPILYMSSKDIFEPLNRAVEDIVFSYYQGTTAKEMVRFVEMFRKGQDPKRAERLFAVQENIPFFDGKSGERIARDIIDGVRNEENRI